MSTILKSLKKCEQTLNNSSDPDLQRILQGGQPSEAKKKSVWPWVFSSLLILNAAVIAFYFPKYGINQSKVHAIQENLIQPEHGQEIITQSVPIETETQKNLDYVASAALKNLVADQISIKLPGKYPEASIRHLVPSELTGLSTTDLQIMRNEIFARHSYIFKTAEIIDYFSQFSWYIPKSEDVTSLLTEIEIENIRLILVNESR